MKKITAFALSLGILIPSAALAQGRGTFGPPEGGPRDGGPPEGPRFGGPPRGPRPGDKGGLMRVWHDIDRIEHEGPSLSKTQAKRIVALVLPWSNKPQMSLSQSQNLRQKVEAVLTNAQKDALDEGPSDFDFRPGPRHGGRRNGDPRDGDPRDGSPRQGPPRDFGPADDGPPRGDGPPRRFRGGPGDDGPPPRGGGRRGPDGRGPRPDWSEDQHRTVRSWMENSNPFYAPTGTANWKNLPATFQKDAARRYQENRAILEALSRKSR